ncbi:MAG: hypothetical protein BRD47_01505 [Bacteroidetes bacterium QS_8_68_28]|nr:MAG: hypothetical protein BRD47_01505 [Bacteroidetes bacterium QS_8_68_28]
MASVFDTSSRSERKQQRQDRLVTLYARAWQFFDQNSGLVYGALAALVALVLGIAGYLYYQNQHLGASEGQAGLLKVAEDYGSTPAGNLARLMAADAYYNTDQPDKALDMLADFEASETLYGAGARALEATIHEDRENFAQAAELYLDAAELSPTEESAPNYLINAGRNFEAAGDYDAALDAYRRVEEDYPDADAASEIPRYIARAKARRQGG